MDDYQEIFVPSASTYAWVMQNLDQMRHSDTQSDSISSPPETPSLYWDSQPSTAELLEPGMQSVFEDWEDDAASAATYTSTVIVEADGAQTVVIPPESAYFLLPSPKKPFGYSFADDELTEADAVSEAAVIEGEVPNVTLTPPNTSTVKGPAHDRDAHVLNVKGLVLHINTAPQPSVGTGAVSFTSAFSTPALRVPDDASWAPKSCMPGPDVPLDCICAGDVSPSAEHWGEEFWSPIVIAPFRSACF